MNWLFTTRQIPSSRAAARAGSVLRVSHGARCADRRRPWNLGPWDAERAAQRAFFAPFDRPAASIVVATSKPQKDWIPERWAATADALYFDFGLQPVLVGGRSPRELAAEQIIRARARAPLVSALGSGLRNLVGILDGSALVLSPDTGPLHMAVALDRPVISLMGYTNPRRTGPYRRFHELIVDAYGDPGESYPISMENRLDRMQRIGVRDVLAFVDRWRGSYAPAVSGPKS
jgi:heptosyltransferase I